MTDPLSESFAFPVGTPEPDQRRARPSLEELVERRVYFAMAGTVISSLQQFLKPLQSVSDSTLVIASMSREDFFPEFYRLANTMIGDCCQELTKIIHASSVLPGVIESSDPALAKRIRETGFGPLDQILREYTGTLGKINAIRRNIKKIQEKMEEVEKSAMVNDSVKANGVENDVRVEGAEDEPWSTDAELARQHMALSKVQALALAQIVQYLKSLSVLFEPLFAYASDKCFGAEVNHTEVREQVASIKVETANLLNYAISIFERATSMTTQQTEEQRRSILNNVAQAHIDAVMEKIWEEKLVDRLKANERRTKGVRIGGWCLLIGIGLCIWMWFYLWGAMALGKVGW